MPSDMNSVHLIGRLTRDPELRSTPGGTSVCDLGVAVNERVKDSNGDWGERVNFFDVTVWDAQAEACSKYLEKGRPVGVSGRLRWESWEHDGQKRSKVKVVANSVQFLSSGEKRDEGSPTPSDVPIDTSGLERTPVAAGASVPVDEDEIPF